MEASITASHTYSHHIYRISALVSMIAGSIKLIDMPVEDMRSICGWTLKHSKHEIYHVQVSTCLPLAFSSHKAALPYNSSSR